MTSPGESPSTFAVMAESAEAAHPCADLPLESRVEALLMVADRPVSEGRISELLGIIDAAPAPRRRRKAAAEGTEGAPPEAAPEPVEETPQQKRAAAQVRDRVVLGVGHHAAERLPTRVAHQHHRVPLLARLGGQHRGPVTEVHQLGPVPLEERLAEQPGVLVIPLAPAVCEPQQVEHYERAAVVLG